MRTRVVSILIFAILFIACEKTIINEQDFAVILGDIDNITTDEGIAKYTIDLSEIFTVQDQPNRILTHSLVSNSNPALLTAQINGSQLVLNITIGQTGTSSIALRSETDQIYKITEFDFIINVITPAAAMAGGGTHFRNAEYNLALSHFTLVIVKNETSLLSDAYMGMGYCLMRLNDETNDYGYGALEISLSYDSENNNARAGLSLLEYAHKRNFSEAIRQGKTTLEKDPDFVFTYDSSLDKNDILLNIALSQFSALLYENCLETVKTLDPAFELESADTEFELLLLQKLEQLIALYS